MQALSEFEEGLSGSGVITVDIMEFIERLVEEQLQRSASQTQLLAGMDEVARAGEALGGTKL